jgi:outer membrane protein assembly factor BamB
MIACRPYLPRCSPGHAGEVTAGVPIIDLDVAPARAETEPRSIGSRVAAGRPLVLLAILALSLVTLGGATEDKRMTRVLAAGGIAAAAFVLGPDALYTAHFGENPNSSSVLRRFDLTDGSLRWAVPVPQNVQSLVLDPSARVLMGRSGVDPKIIFWDADSGEALWREEQPDVSVVGMARGTVLMRVDVSVAQTMLRLADARTGRPIWSQAVDPTAELGPDDLYGEAPSRIVAVGAGGAVTVLDFADGTVLGEGDLHVEVPGRADPFVPANFVAVSTVGDRLYVSRRERGRASLTAYSTVPVARLWRVEGGPVGRVIDCASVLCVADTRWVSGVDPVTGAERWAEPRWSTAFRYDATRLFAYDQQEDPEAALLDAATGRVERRLGHTFRLGDLMLRTDDKVVARTWVAKVDPDGALHTVGSMDTATPFGCELRDSYLACPTTAGPTMVWRVP